MTNELEKQFFDTFGIKPKYKGYSNTEELSTGGVIPCGNIKYFNTIEEMDKANYWCFNMWELGEEDKEYPQITDHILLELICIANHEDVYIELVGTDVETMKNNLLENFIHFKRIVPKHQVQALFEEG